MFAKLAKRQLQRGVFPSVVALQEAINQFVATHNRAADLQANPFAESSQL